jgi:hypothetical protein
VKPYDWDVPLGTVLGDSCRWCVLWDTSKVKEAAGQLGLRLNRPEAGSFVLLDTGGTRFADKPLALALELLSHGVAVAPSSVLTPHADPEPPSFIRIGLAQPADHMELFVNALTLSLRSPSGTQV